MHAQVLGKKTYSLSRPAKALLVDTFDLTAGAFCSWGVIWMCAKKKRGKFATPSLSDLSLVSLALFCVLSLSRCSLPLSVFSLVLSSRNNKICTFAACFSLSESGFLSRAENALLSETLTGTCGANQGKNVDSYSHNKEQHGQQKQHAPIFCIADVYWRPLLVFVVTGCCCGCCGQTINPKTTNNSMQLPGQRFWDCLLL